MARRVRATHKSGHKGGVGYSTGKSSFHRKTSRHSGRRK